MTWDWKPSVVIGCLGLLALYTWSVKGHFNAKASAWLTGVTLIFIALCSPLDTLADTYLFSVHMAKHIAFVLVIPALLLIAMPPEPFERVLRVKWVRALERILRKPAIAWASGVGVMLAWHLPPLFNAALRNEPLHIVEHLSLLVGGTIYWWPILSPLPESRMQPVPQAVVYLFTSCLACTAMGVAITFAPVLLYPPYLPAVREQLGISAQMDQQIGGLLMWVPGCLVYLTAIMGMFARWYGEQPEHLMEV